MKIQTRAYEQAKVDATKIVEIATELRFLGKMEEQDVVVKEKNRSGYEESRLRDMKNLITNLYLTLELQDVRGVADEIFDDVFQSK